MPWLPPPPKHDAMQKTHIQKSAIGLELDYSMYLFFSEFNLLEFYKTIYKESTKIFKISTKILQKNLQKIY